MPTFDATSTVSALITSMQNPLWKQMSGETERDGEGGKIMWRIQGLQEGLEVGVAGGWDEGVRGEGGGVCLQPNHTPNPCQC